MPSNRLPFLIRLLVALFVPRANRECFLGDLEELSARNHEAHGTDLRGRHCSLLREAMGAAQLIGAARRQKTSPNRKGGDRMLHELAQDIRFGLRLLARSPGFTVVAVVTIALGIGATTAIFSVVNAVLLEPLPFLEPARLMRPSLVVPPRSTGPTMHREVVWSMPKYEVFKASQEAFSDSAIYMGSGFTLTGDGDPERIAGEVVDSSYLGVLGIEAEVGRGFTREDDLPGAAPVVIVSHGFWLRRWGGDPSVEGHTLTLTGNPYTVVGVLPRGFKGLSGRAEVFIPTSILGESDRTSVWSHSFLMVARLKDGVTPVQARANMEAVGRRLDEAFPTTDVSLQGWSATARQLNELRATPVLRTSMLLLLGAVGFVLLIACVNLASLLLARATGRRREIAIRLALGSGRGRLVRQLMTESLLLGAGGAAAGLGLAYLVVEHLRSLGPATRGVIQGDSVSLTVLGLDRIALDGTTLLFTLVVALSTAILAGLAPAFGASRPDLARELRVSSGWWGGARRYGGMSGRGTLVVAELALTFVLLAGSGLMLGSLVRLHAVDAGFVPEGVLTASVSLPYNDYDPNERDVFFTELLEQIRAHPGVQSAGMTNSPPVSGRSNSTVIRFFDRPEVQEGAEPSVDIHMTTPGFFETLGVPLIRGRTFDERDRLGKPLTVILSERAASEFWPGEDPIGKTVGLGQAGFWDGAEVVGIVGDVHYEAIETPPNPTSYVPMSQARRNRGYLFVRAQGDPTPLAGLMRQTVKSLDANVPVTSVRTMNERVDDATVRTRFSAGLLSLFAALALALSAVGIFGVLSHLVAQQSHEIGIRMALGAQRSTVFRQVLRRAILMTALGVGLGGTASLWLMRFIGTLLFEVRPDDPATLAAIALTLSAVSLAAAYLPAWRAMRVQPVEALREG